MYYNIVIKCYLVKNFGFVIFLFIFIGVNSDVLVLMVERGLLLFECVSNEICMNNIYDN